ncbi:MAG TPA: hypothetical protein VGE74_00980, partial [Gemmata sp.]
VYMWFTGEEGTVFGTRGGEALLHSVIRQQLVPDEDVVRSVWKRLLAEIETTIAGTVRGVVPHEVVRRWLDRRRVVYRPPEREEHRASEAERSGTPTTAARAAAIGSEAATQQVLDGLRLLTQAAADPGLADSLGIIEHAPLADWLTPALPQIESRRVTATGGGKLSPPPRPIQSRSRWS